MDVPYIDLVAQHAPLKADLLAAVERVIDHGWFILGPEVETFEQRLAAMIGVKHVIGVGNGTDALVLALRALGVGPGDEVITAPNSYVASATCIALCGATPVFADVGEDYNLDPAAVEAAITPRTKAVVAVHLTGRPARLPELSAVCDAAGIELVEDCAQAILASQDGRQVGTWGRLGCFSLHPLKTLNALGDGGLITTDDDDLAADLRMRRTIGHADRDHVALWAPNTRLDALQAAMLLVKLDVLEAWTEARRARAQRYREALTDLPGLALPASEPAGMKAVYHTFIVQVEQRDALAVHLAAAGIGTKVHYPIPIHLQAAAADLGHGEGDFPVTEAQAGRILSLPVHPEMSEAQQDHVITEVRAFFTS